MDYESTALTIELAALVELAGGSNPLTLAFTVLRKRDMAMASTFVDRIAFTADKRTIIKRTHF